VERKLSNKLKNEFDNEIENEYLPDKNYNNIKSQTLDDVNQGLNLLKSLEKVRQKTGQLNRLLVDFEDLETELAFYQQEFQLLTERWLRSQAELANKNNELKRSQMQLKIQKHHEEQYEIDFKNLKNELNNYQNEIKARQELISEKDKKIAELQQKLQKSSIFNKKIDQSEGELKKTEMGIIEGQLALQKKIQEVNELQEHLENRQEETEINQRDEIENDKEITLLKQQVDEINREMQEEERIFKNLLNEMDSIKLQLDHSTLNSKDPDDLVELLQQELYSKQSELDEVNVNLEMRNEIIQKLKTNRVFAVDKQPEIYKEKYCELLKQYDRIQEDHNELKSAVEKMIGKNSLQY